MCLRLSRRKRRRSGRHLDRREQYDALLQDLQALQGALAADGLAVSSNSAA
ncbi:hypothetical protein MJK72_16580 [Klebsiella pneumoniae]|nr:hypothetical protein MJK72_16580 [Klebsiella pneumoniae]